MAANTLEAALQQKTRAVEAAVLAWARDHLRDYPWRREPRTPYSTLIAEVLLKRTTATAVDRVYSDFLGEYPSLKYLATASIAELSSALRPIGLQTQRSGDIKKLGEYLVEHEGGVVPSTLSNLLELPGIGEYSARAVLSFGHGEPAAVLDGNVERVLTRVFHSSMPPRPSRRVLQELADALLPQGQHARFNFGLLDLGALVCRYSTPRCVECPMQTVCDYFQTGQVARGREKSRLRHLRQENGLTLVALARGTRLSKLTLINIEAGRTRPRSKTLEKLAAYFGAAVEDISGQTTDTK